MITCLRSLIGHCSLQSLPVSLHSSFCDNDSRKLFMIKSFGISLNVIIYLYNLAYHVVIIFKYCKNHSILILVINKYMKSRLFPVGQVDLNLSLHTFCFISLFYIFMYYIIILVRRLQVLLNRLQASRDAFVWVDLHWVRSFNLHLYSL